MNGTASKIGTAGCRIADVAAVSSLGDDWPTIWAGLLAGAHRPMPFAETGIPFRINELVSAVTGLDRSVEIARPGYGASCRLLRHVVAALRHVCDGSEIQVFGGTNHGESDAILALVRRELGEETSLDDADVRTLEEALFRDPQPRFFEMPGAQNAGRSAWSYSACCSGAHAFVEAVIELADEPVPERQAVVVASDAISAIGVGGFSNARALSKSTCTPFMERRDGLLVGEGAAAVLLVAATDGRIDGPQVAGVGLACDAYHPTLPDPQGRGVTRAVGAALEMAEISPPDVSAAILHGTGTEANDNAEALAVQAVFGKSGPPVTSIKGLMGHAMGASGLFNILVAAQAMRDGVLPAVAGNGSAPIAGLDVVMSVPREISPGPVLVCCSGFGGNNVAVVLVP